MPGLFLRLQAIAREAPARHLQLGPTASTKSRPNDLTELQLRKDPDLIDVAAADELSVPAILGGYTHAWLLFQVATDGIQQGLLRQFIRYQGSSF